MTAARRAALWWRGRRGVALCTIGLILPGVLLVMFVPVTWDAYRLRHEATAISSNVSVKHVRHCLRSCWSSTKVTVSFPDAQGSTEEAVLRGVAQDASYYRSGISVVYDARRPEVAMAVRDYQDGRGLWPKIVLPLTMVAVVGELVLAVRFVRRGALRSR